MPTFCPPAQAAEIEIAPPASASAEAEALAVPPESRDDDVQTAGGKRVSASIVDEAKAGACRYCGDKTQYCLRVILVRSISGLRSIDADMTEVKVASRARVAFGAARAARSLAARRQERVTSFCKEYQMHVCCVFPHKCTYSRSKGYVDHHCRCIYCEVREVWCIGTYLNPLQSSPTDFKPKFLGVSTQNYMRNETYVW